ncbi:MAG: hypothetical protein PHF86_05560 [Candidatus Nanoarchaeia archaeon]|nr:hypothetical protein [Candidatus Nanoarchaeia archaeon]
MKQSQKELLMYLGIITGLFNAFMNPNIPTYFWWISGIATLIFSIATIAKAYQVIIGK